LTDYFLRKEEERCITVAHHISQSIRRIDATTGEGHRDNEVALLHFPTRLIVAFLLT
jgi:hypothetical protein